MAMNWTQYLLGKLAEEAAEVAKEALKEQQQGVGSMWKGRPAIMELRNELHELLAVADRLAKQPDVDDALGIHLLTPSTECDQDSDTYTIKTDKLERLCYYAMFAYESGNLVLKMSEYIEIHANAVYWAAKKNEANVDHIAFKG